MNRPLSKLLLSCREATVMASGLLDSDLSAWQRVRLRLHLSVCSWCRRNLAQLKIIRVLIADHSHDDSDGLGGLSPEARVRISRRLGADEG